ncbi:MAG: purine-nucleoside phosphorylase [Anaerolineae bacterium CG2_30_64_16]|nr:MAG: purine-nucleoside phosphorylase [Anaerolineae bacterium CG2_30_64_16]
MIDYEVFSRAQYQEAADAIRQRTAHRPQVGLILGSGLNPLADEVVDADRIAYAEVPHFPGTSVVGHIGQLVIGELSGQTVLIMQGRTHAYEGVSLQRVTLPVRVMHELGIHTLIVTNAAGGINPDFRAGDLMLIVDHLGLMAMMGGNPLWGPNDESLGPRFPAMSKAYTPALRRLALEVAAREGIPLRQGVYGGLSGPAFETPAEVRFLRLIGVDAIGMSTVPEVMVACHMGMRVLGFSGISNAAIAELDTEAEADHEEVLVAGQILGPRLMALLRGILAELPA